MKKSLKMIAVAFASIMLLTAIATPAALAATNGPVSSVDRYILEQLPNSIPLSDGSYYVPGFGVVSGDDLQELYKLYWGTLYPSYTPSLPILPDFPFLPIYPGNGNVSIPSGIQQISVEMNQFEHKYLGMGTSYTYTSMTPDIVTVDQYGYIYAKAAGEGMIALSKGAFTWMLVKVTVNGIDFDPTVYSVDLYVSKHLMSVEDTASVYARVMKDGYYAISAVQSMIQYKVDDTSVVTLKDGVLTGVGVGTTTVTAYIPDTELSDTFTIQIIAKADKPSTPTYPTYPNYPFYPSLPSLPVLPNYPFYPGFDPSFGTVVAPNYGVTNMAEWLGLDADVYKVVYKVVFTNGAWRQVLVAVPKDSDGIVDLSNYVLRNKLVLKNGEWTAIPYMIPKDTIEVTPETPEKEEDEEDTKLTPEEQEALQKAEEEAKKQAELKKQIAKALKGEIEWYDVYTDLNGDASYYSGVEFVLSKQYLTGKDNGKFGTKDEMTYDDVKALFQKYLQLTSEEFDKTGILTIKDGKKVITRQEITQAFYNLAKYMDEDVSATASFKRYKDAKELKSEYSQAFGWAIKTHIIITTSTKMTPNDAVTRGALAQMLYRFDIIVK